MVYTLVLEASAERIESSSLSRRTTIWADSDNGSTVALQASGGSSILPRSTKRKYMKTRKPRNYVILALLKRNGSGSHTKSHKQLRGKWKRNLDV